MVSAPDRQLHRSYSSQQRRRLHSAETRERSATNRTNALMIRHGPGGSGQRSRGVHSAVRITGACSPSRIRSTPAMPWFSGAVRAPPTASPECELTFMPPIVMRTGLIVTSREINPDRKKSLAVRSALSRPCPRDQTKQDTSPCPVFCKAGASWPSSNETTMGDETAMEMHPNFIRHSSLRCAFFL